MGLLTLADHLHDIAENSINARAKNVRITVVETKEEFYFSVEDDAGGMSPELLKSVFDPFVTTRNKDVRRVGLGLPLLKQAAEATGGYVKIESKLGEGTKTEVLFRKDHIDCQPVGDLVGTFLALLMNTSINWRIRRCFNEDCYELSSELIGQFMGDLNSAEKIKILAEMLSELESGVSAA